MKLTLLLRRIVLFAILPVTLLIVSGLAWLRWEAHQNRDDWFEARHGELVGIATEKATTEFGQLAESVTLQSSSGLRVVLRVIRAQGNNDRRPVLLVLGGHRTGSDAVDLFGRVGNEAVVGIDYPYDGPEKVRGMRQSIEALPAARAAFLDTVPAVSLVIDWLLAQPWVDKDGIIIVGASLGVPFAATAAARDTRISGAMLVHGAADNRLWLEAQVARRIDVPITHYPVSVLLHWLAYGPLFDTSKQVAAIAPRPIVIVGARDDERTPAGQSELLFAAAGNPKRLFYTDGAHIEPDRTDIVAALLRIARDELPFLTATYKKPAQ